MTVRELQNILKRWEKTAKKADMDITINGEPVDLELTFKVTNEGIWSMDLKSNAKNQN